MVLEGAGAIVVVALISVAVVAAGMRQRFIPVRGPLLALLSYVFFIRE